MKEQFEIHFALPDGTEDYVIVSGDSIEEVQRKAAHEVARRNGRAPWSKELP